MTALIILVSMMGHRCVGWLENASDHLRDVAAVTQNPDRNITMPTGLEGEGFVILDMPVSTLPRHLPIGEPRREVWTGIKDDVAELERLMK